MPHPSPPSHSGSLGAAALPQVAQTNDHGISISPSANVTPDMLAPKAVGNPPNPATSPDLFDSSGNLIFNQKGQSIGGPNAASSGATPGAGVSPAQIASEWNSTPSASSGADVPTSSDIAQILSQYQFAHGGAARHPTDAQKKAGNYAKGHIRFHGLDISIENPKGSLRRGKEASGKPWSVVMPADYGYVRGTEGADGDHVDVYVGPHPESTTAFIINQRHHDTGKWDEHKAMLGYRSEKEAVADYCKAFSDGKGAARIKSVETVSIDAFKNWLKRGKTKSAAKSSSIVDHAIQHVIGRHARG